ncbi:hypothetical protein PspLS_05118 [Pyricularia sp. CBS 133598]|nr:hypothetical protein PspLS_05118 [Pyricularia sp. CBS 133598]
MAGWFVPPPNRQGNKGQVRTLMATLRSAPRSTRQFNLGGDIRVGARNCVVPMRRKKENCEK